MVQSLPMSTCICIIGAIKEEIAGIKQRMRVDNTHRMGHAALFAGEWLGTRVLLVRSGMGKDRARQALEALFEKASPDLIVSIGYAGGLEPGLNTGDLVLADHVLTLDAETKLNFDSCQTTLKETVDKDLLDRAILISGSVDIKLHRGGLLTVDAPILNPVDKKALGLLYKVMAVDMETWALVSLAKEKDIPFLSIRSISDTVDQELLDCSGLVDETGEVSKLKAGWHVVTHPGSIKGLLDLGRQTRKATANLTDFVTRFLLSYKA